MKKVFQILRRENAQSTPYWEEFIFETDDMTATVASALRKITDESRCRSGDAQDRQRSGGASAGQGSGSGAANNPGRPLVWENSCFQKRCGACAMVINGVPKLACDTFLKDLKGEKVRLEPLKKFPVVEDLLVDRTIMMQNLKELKAWFEEEAVEGSESMVFEASRCIQCGLCLEVCPNFAPGDSFSGMAGMVPLARIIARLPEKQRKSMAKQYTKGVFNGCGKSLACRDICPAKVPIEHLLVKSNAAAVWRRWKTVLK